MPVETELVTNATTAASWTAIIGGGMMGLRWLFKTFRKDVQEVQLDGEQDKILQSWKDLAAQYKTEAEEHAKRADELSEERNKAIEEVGELKGQIAALTQHVEALQKQITIMQQTISHMEKILVQYNAAALTQPLSLGNVLHEDLISRQNLEEGDPNDGLPNSDQWKG